MKTRFAYELIIGIIGFAATLWFGSAGMVALTLLAFQPFIGGRNPLIRGEKDKWDEREQQLFFKTGNYTAGFTIVALVTIFELKDISINNHLINNSWLGFASSSFLIAHGLSGLIIFKNSKIISTKTKQLHPNFIKSSNLIFASVGLGLINFFFFSNILTTEKNIVITILSFLLIAGLGYIVRIGEVWVKYLILIMTIFSLIGMVAIIYNLSLKISVGVIIIPQTVLQVLALILLFRIPNTIEQK